MNPFVIIKELFQIRSIVKNLNKEAQMPTVSGKPGWKTTEFWLNVAVQAGVLWSSVKGFVPPQYAAMISIGGVAVYTVARTVTKAISDIKATKNPVPVA